MMIMKCRSQGLSRTFYIKFQNFQGPILFSRIFHVLEKWLLFRGLLRKWGHPENKKTTEGIRVHHCCIPRCCCWVGAAGDAVVAVVTVGCCCCCSLVGELWAEITASRPCSFTTASTHAPKHCQIPSSTSTTTTHVQRPLFQDNPLNW